jgi:hypothetical protein
MSMLDYFSFSDREMYFVACSMVLGLFFCILVATKDDLSIQLS